MPEADGIVAEGAPERIVLELTMVNKRGLHARAAARFVQTAERYAATVEVAKDGHVVDGRSIMGLLMLGVPMGSSVEVVVSGAAREEAAAALAALVADGFGERDD